jgi:dGTPase
VFIDEEGDHYRTRLTHTIEVAQIARSLARNLNVDSDLTEALALAHDLGHTPFGHTGEDALAERMAPYGGFEHNAQTLRILTHLEQRYAAFDGLNLTLETLDGIIKHNGPLLDDSGAVLDPKLEGELPFALAAFLQTAESAGQPFNLTLQAGLEAQIAAISDDIAYNTHDIDDGVRAGFFTLDDLTHIPLIGRIVETVENAHPGLPRERRMGEFSRRLITTLIMDVEARVRAGLTSTSIHTGADVRQASFALAQFSDDVAQDVWMVKAFLFKTLYRHEGILSVRAEADRVVQQLFDYFLTHPDRMPADWQLSPINDKAVLARRACDFVAGMTDRYALNLHARLFDDTPDLRYGAPV